MDALTLIELIQHHSEDQTVLQAAADLHVLVLREPEQIADRIMTAIDKYQRADALEWIGRMESAFEERENTQKIVDKVNHLCHSIRLMVEAAYWDDAREQTKLFARLFHPDGAKICAGKRRRCPSCQEPFSGAHRDDYICPVCEAGRGVCLNPPELNGRCPHHGGRAARGMAVNTFKDGTHSRYFQHMPMDYREILESVLVSKDMLSLVEDVQLLVTRIGYLLERMPDGDVRADPSTINHLRREYEKALEDRDLILARGAYPEVDKALKLASSFISNVYVVLDDRSLWAEIRETQEQIRRLIDTEVRREQAAREVWTVDRIKALLYTLTVTVVELLDKNIDDPQTAKTIKQDLNHRMARLLAGGEIASRSS